MGCFVVFNADCSVNRWGQCSDGMEMASASEPGEFAIACAESVVMQVRSNPSAYRGNAETKEIIPA